MKIIHGQRSNRFGGTLIAASRALRLSRLLGGVLFIGLVHSPVHIFSASLPGTNKVALAWDGSPSSQVTSYRIYYGGPSGNYTNSVAVGNVTTGTVSGLASGITYFFAVAARTASGLESDLSNGVSYAVPGSASTMRVSIGSNRQVTLTLTGQSGQTYGIEATQDFKTWTLIGTATVGVSGSANFTDANAASLPKRFYRNRR